MTSSNQIDLLAFHSHGAADTTAIDGALYCATEPGLWQYAISYPLPKEALVSTSNDLLLKIEGRITSGEVGIGIVGEDYSTYLAEERFGAGDAEFCVVIVAAAIPNAHYIVFRNHTQGHKRAEFQLLSIEIDEASPSNPATLHSVTQKPFEPRADRSSKRRLASINTTEVCNLSCVMCHFNGPHAVKKTRKLNTEQVAKILDGLSPGEQVWFCATGEFFVDTNAVSYLEMAHSRGLKPCVLTHGQLFTEELIDSVLGAGVRLVRMSVDSTDAAQYRKIRRGGELDRILSACRSFKERKREFPDLRVEINVTLFKNTFVKQDQMIEFWRPLVDQVNFNAEYYNTFRFRNLFFVPTRRVDCNIEMYVMPSGRIAPCCAMAVYQHDHDVSWLPHVDEISSLEEAQAKLYDLYEDKHGPMSSICAKCDWWILSITGKSPYIRSVPLSDNGNID
jgi:MoaA/NifB/PqqE/SkfB family radical SAM enzyme